MNSLNWGLLGPEKLESSRRTRTLGLGACVRNFNEFAVPGMGSVWFVRQLILPLIGIRLATEAREKGQKVTNLEVANSLEALGCLLAIKLNPESVDGRVRGRNKFQNISDDKLNQLAFNQVKKKNFYVTQPMRMATTSVLPALGLVCEGESRFNNFVLSDKGKNLVTEATKGCRPHNNDLFTYLCDWMAGKGNRKIKNDKVTFVRLEQLYPFPAKTLANILKRYDKAEFIWCQEEPKNMGAWNTVRNYIDRTLEMINLGDKSVKYVGRNASSSTATGNLNKHLAQQKEILEKILKD